MPSNKTNSNKYQIPTELETAVCHLLYYLAFIYYTAVNLWLHNLHSSPQIATIISKNQMSSVFRSMHMRSAITLRRTASLLRPTSSSLGGIRTKKTTTVFVSSNRTTPEDIVNECQSIRESIQALNDVRSFFSLLETPYFRSI